MGFTAQVFPPFELTAKKGAVGNVVGVKPAATQIASVPEPVQLTPLNNPSLGAPETVFTVQVLAPSVLTASKGAPTPPATLAPTAAQIVLLGVEPLQLTLVKRPVVAPEIDFTDHERPPSVLAAINGVFPAVTFKPPAIQIAVAPEPVQLTLLKLPAKGVPEKGLTVQVAVPSLLTSKTGAFGPVCKVPAAAQIDVEPEPVQLMDSSEPAGVLGNVFTDQVAAPSVLATINKSPPNVLVFPEAAQTEVEPDPVQLALRRLPPTGMPEIGLTDQVVPPSVVDVTKGRADTPTEPAATHTVSAVVLPVQVAPLMDAGLVVAPTTVGKDHDAPPSVLCSKIKGKGLVVFCPPAINVAKLRIVMVTKLSEFALEQTLPTKPQTLSGPN